jgi:hypothetical protein
VGQIRLWCTIDVDGGCSPDSFRPRPTLLTEESGHLRSFSLYTGATQVRAMGPLLPVLHSGGVSPGATRSE